MTSGKLASQRNCERFQGLHTEAAEMGQTTNRNSHMRSRPSDGLQRAERPTIAVLGGAGTVGTHLLNAADRKGHAVRVLAGDPMSVPVSQKTTIVVGDPTDQENIEQLVDGADVVISCIETSHKQDFLGDTESSTTTQNVIRALSQTRLSRYIVLSSNNLVLDTDPRRIWTRLYTRYVARRFRSDILKDKFLESDLLRESNLDWTMIRCPKIKDAASKSQIEVSEKPIRGAFIRAGELADFLVEQIDSQEYLKRALFVSSRK